MQIAYLVTRYGHFTSDMIDVINDLIVTPVKSIVDINIEKYKNAYRISMLIDEDKIDVNSKNGCFIYFPV